MKKNVSTKMLSKRLAQALVSMLVVFMAFPMMATPFKNLYVTAEVYPAGAGTVFLDVPNEDDRAFVKEQSQAPGATAMIKATLGENDTDASAGFLAGTGFYPVLVKVAAEKGYTVKCIASELDPTGEYPNDIRYGISASGNGKDANWFYETNYSCQVTVNNPDHAQDGHSIDGPTREEAFADGYWAEEPDTHLVIVLEKKGGEITNTLPNYNGDCGYEWATLDKDELHLALFQDEVKYTGVKAYKDRLYDRLFQRTAGWNGGDGVYTVQLPNQDILWVFNDSFYGKVNGQTRARTNSNFPRNSIMVQKAYKTEDGKYKLGEGGADFVWLADYLSTDASSNQYMNARTHLRHPAARQTINDAAIQSGSIDQLWLYWFGDGVIVERDGKYVLQCLWSGVDNEGNKMAQHDQMVAQYRLDGTQPEDFYGIGKPDYNPQADENFYLHRYSEDYFVNWNTIPYGATMMEEGEWVYLYCNNNDAFGNSLKYQYAALVARAPRNDLGGKWQYYVRGQWVDEAPNGDKDAIYDSRIVNSQVNMPWVFKSDNGKYYMVAQRGYFSRDVYLYEGETPWSFNQNGKLLVTLPDKLDKKGSQEYNWLYMINLHRELSREGEIVLTTNTDAKDWNDNFNSEGSADFYRPYTYRVFGWENLFDGANLPIHDNPLSGVQTMASSTKANFKVRSIGRNVVISVEDLEDQAAVYTISDLAGRAVAGGNVRDTAVAQLPQAGCYVVNVKREGASMTQKVFVR